VSAKSENVCNRRAKLHPSKGPRAVDGQSLDLKKRTCSVSGKSRVQSAGLLSIGEGTGSTELLAATLPGDGTGSDSAGRIFWIALRVVRMDVLRRGDSDRFSFKGVGVVVAFLVAVVVVVDVPCLSPSEIISSEANW
jgi:hypothetical protein